MVDLTDETFMAELKMKNRNEESKLFIKLKHGYQVAGYILEKLQHFACSSGFMKTGSQTIKL